MQCVCCYSCCASQERTNVSAEFSPSLPTRALPTMGSTNSVSREERWDNAPCCKRLYSLSLRVTWDAVLMSSRFPLNKPNSQLLGRVYFFSWHWSEGWIHRQKYSFCWSLEFFLGIMSGSTLYVFCLKQKNPLCFVIGLALPDCVISITLEGFKH